MSVNDVMTLTLVIAALVAALASVLLSNTDYFRKRAHSYTTEASDYTCSTTASVDLSSIWFEDDDELPDSEYITVSRDKWIAVLQDNRRLKQGLAAYRAARTRKSAVKHKVCVCHG